jgi:hypothetical protein
LDDGEYLEFGLNWITKLQLLRLRAVNFDTLGNEVPALNWFNLASQIGEEIAHWLTAHMIGKWAFKNVFDKESGVCIGALFRFEDERSAMLFKLRFGCSGGKLGRWVEFNQI